MVEDRLTAFTFLEADTLQVAAQCALPFLGRIPFPVQAHVKPADSALLCLVVFSGQLNEEVQNCGGTEVRPALMVDPELSPPVTPTPRPRLSFSSYRGSMADDDP